MTMPDSDVPYLEEIEERYQWDPDFVAEQLALDITEQAASIMQDQGITRTRLAELLHVSRSYVTRTFNAPPNLTLHTIAQIAVALGATPKVRLELSRPSTSVRQVVSGTSVDTGLSSHVAYAAYDSPEPGTGGFYAVAVQSLSYQLSLAGPMSAPFAFDCGHVVLSPSPPMIAQQAHAGGGGTASRLAVSESSASLEVPNGSLAA
jgi:transcriptional regulator with XRE-family HTH domain